MERGEIEKWRQRRDGERRDREMEREERWREEEMERGRLICICVHYCLLGNGTGSSI